MEKPPVVAALEYVLLEKAPQLIGYKILEPEQILLKEGELFVSLDKGVFFRASKEKFLQADSPEELEARFLELQKRIKEEGYMVAWGWEE